MGAATRLRRSSQLQWRVCASSKMKISLSASGGLGVRQHQRDQRAQRAKSGTIKSLVNLYLLYSLVC